MSNEQVIAFACLGCFVLACLGTAVSYPIQRWLRDDLWPTLADQLRTIQSERPVAMARKAGQR